MPYIAQQSTASSIVEHFAILETSLVTCCASALYVNVLSAEYCPNVETELLKRALNVNTAEKSRLN
jgi:hypothetical protein